MKAVRGLLSSFCAETFVAALWIALAPLTSKVPSRLSTERAALLAVAATLCAVFLLTAIAGWRSAAFTEALQAWLDRWCAARKRLTFLLLILAVIPIALLVGSLLLANVPVAYKTVRAGGPDTASMLRSWVLATLPFQALTAALALESAAYLGIRYRQELRDPAMWPWRRLGLLLLGLVAAFLTILYWLVLVFQLRVLKSNPAWYWKLRLIPFGRGDLIFLLIAICLLGIAYWALVLRRQVAAGLTVLFILALFVQFGVGLMSGGGFAAFQDRYLSTYHKTYITRAAASSASLAQTVEQYELLYGNRSFTETKPPGLMVFYTALDHALSGFPSRSPENVRLQRLVMFVSFAFPALAAALVLAVYAFARRYAPGASGMAPGLAAFLLVLCPNFVLFSLYPDQALYPLVFLFGVLLIVVSIQRQSLPMAFALGMFLYLAVFFAFTTLPLYPFAGLYLVLHYWRNRRELSLWRTVGQAALIGAGTLLLYFAFRGMLHYDFIPRFAKTMTINHNFDFYLRVGQPLPAGPESFQTRLVQIIKALWLNNLDFSTSIGYAIYALFLVQAIRLVARLRKGSSSPADLVMAALFLSFVVLNLAGTAQGEVPRLWLFWMPMVVIGAAVELESALAPRPWLVLLLAGTQLVTLFLTFHFQDLRM